MNLFMASVNIAFEAPDNGRGAATSTSRPIDLDHLAVQTMGDKALEAEVLALFTRQARAALNEIGDRPAEAVVAAAHRLRSAANAVGAFAVVKATEALESQPDSAAARAAVAATVLDAENFILKLLR
ncbi:Hpt domain-containing protein [Rhizobium sp. CSW-27]|uniref:Hpt domain-containing protein n=1 Tax=Rhizobium sp. CSW-27 TaxID=2839985 RepID=UPI002078B43E|nr:Hpt domain-containing protein [Rhizobium sp. CSW-27]